MQTAPLPRGAATREQVLSHAAAMIRERGFRSTSLGDLLERADVQKGSFYYYFASKEALGHAVLDRWTVELKSRLLDPLTAADGPPPLQRVAAALDGFIAEMDATGCRGGCPFGNLAIEMADVHEGFRERLSGAFVALTSAFTGLLERARKAGDLRANTDPRALGQFLVAAIEGGILLARVHRSSAPLATVLRVARAHLDSCRAGV